MIRLWTASPNKEINDLSVQIEKNRFEIRKLEVQLYDAQNKMRQTNGFLGSMQEAVDNLKKDETKIVSMSEFLSLELDIQKASTAGINLSNLIISIRKAIDKLNKDNADLEEKKKKIESNHGHILEFKKRG